jgi:HAD superfamily hydrolase (TIGR01509 family)
MPDITIFLDDGGVMNDNSIRFHEWQRMVGEFFAPRLGGSERQWADANRAIVDTEPWNAALRPGEAYDDWYRRYQVDWLRVMAGRVGVSMPPEDEALALAIDAARFVTSNCHSAFPDAPAAIRTLSEMGLALCTASGEDSHELDGYLTGMGVRDLFTHLFGPDLTGAFKRGPDYYERAFDHACLDPSQCLVVDDSLQAIGWATTAGARTVLVDRKGSRPAEYQGLAVTDLGQLAPLIDRLRSG